MDSPPPPPLPLPTPQYEHVFLPVTVCSITTTGGSGHGILCTLKNAPCVLTPCHVLCGESSVGDFQPENVAAFVRAPPGSEGLDTQVELKMRPDVFFAHSPPPPDGRPPDVNRMDYVVVAVEVVGGDSRRDDTNANVSEQKAKQKLLSKALFTRALEDARPVHSLEGGDEVHFGVVSTSTEGNENKNNESVSVTTWRRGFVTSAHSKHSNIQNVQSADKKITSLVSIRYDARTVPGESGGAVCSVAKRGIGELPKDFVSRKAKGNAKRGTGALLAMHRAGLPGEDGEGVLVSEIFKDIRETLATRNVRVAAKGGNTAVACLELNRIPGESRGTRSRAAAAAAEVVAKQPYESVAAMAAIAEKGGYVPSGADRALSACDALEQCMCAWSGFDPKSSRLAHAICHALGALARARMKPAKGGEEGNTCVRAIADQHYQNQAVREKAEWAARMRRALQLK